MGYTHYWGAMSCPPDTWQAILSDFKAAQRACGIPLAGYTGKGEAEASDKEISFNGAGDDSYESFIVVNGGASNEFCKTARKPYDIMVCTTLMILKNYVPAFDVSSDGGADDWEEAIEFCRRVLGYGEYPCKRED